MQTTCKVFFSTSSSCRNPLVYALAYFVQFLKPLLSVAAILAPAFWFIERIHNAARLRSHRGEIRAVSLQLCPFCEYCFLEDDVTRIVNFFSLVTVGWSSRFRSWDLVSRRPEFFPHSDQSYSSWECAGMWETAATTTPSAMWQMCLFFPQQNLVQPQVITQSAYLLIAAGAFVFIVSFLGYCGAVKESRVLLGLVGISLLFWLMIYIWLTPFCVVRRLRFGDRGLGNYRRKSGSDLPTGGNISFVALSLPNSINFLCG